jgi:DNA repair protein RadC
MLYEAIYIKKPKKKKKWIKTSQDAYDLLKPFLNSRQEQCIVITMSDGQEVIGIHVVHIGSVTNVTGIPRDIFYRAILDNASSIILAHNHIGDNITPSENDLIVADRFYKAGTIMGIYVRDQLVISEYGYSSIKPSIKAVINGEIKIK